jgi:hypothetical protein
MRRSASRSVQLGEPELFETQPVLSVSKVPTDDRLLGHGRLQARLKLCPAVSVREFQLTTSQGLALRLEDSFHGREEHAGCERRNLDAQDVAESRVIDLRLMCPQRHLALLRALLKQEFGVRLLLLPLLVRHESHHRPDDELTFLGC